MASGPIPSPGSTPTVRAPAGAPLRLRKTTSVQRPVLPLLLVFRSTTRSPWARRGYKCRSPAADPQRIDSRGLSGFQRFGMTTPPKRHPWLLGLAAGVIAVSVVWAIFLLGRAFPPRHVVMATRPPG